MLDYPVLSVKTIGYILLLSTLFLIGSVLISRVNPNTKLSICTDKKGNSMVILSNKNTNILIHPTYLKETLECIGDSLSFYDRTVEYILGSMRNDVQNELTNRYSFQQSTQNTFSISSTFVTYQSKPFYHLKLQGEEGEYIIVLKSDTDVRYIQKYISNNKNTKVLLPTTYQQTWEKSSELQNMQTLFFHEGNNRFSVEELI